MIKKIMTLGIISIITCSGYDTSDVAYAVDGENAHSVQECREGDLELYTFLQTVIGAHGIVVGITDPFLDIFRNDCQIYDIMILDSQQDTIGRSIQDAFLMCDREKIPMMKRAYYEIDAELYYVRHILKVTPLSSVKETLSKATMNVITLSRDDEKFTPINRLYSDMYNLYVTKIGGLSSTEFDDLFNILESKYSDRMKSYVSCQETGWNQVKDKLIEFRDNLGGLREGWEETRDQVLEGAEAINNSIAPLTATESKGFVENVFDMKLNGVAPLEGFKEIVESAGKNDFWSSGSDTIDQATALRSIGNAKEDYNAKIDEAKLRAKYVSLYKGNSDAYLREFLRVLDETQFYIFKGISYLRETEKCVQNMVNKQCP